MLRPQFVQVAEKRFTIGPGDFDRPKAARYGRKHAILINDKFIHRSDLLSFIDQG
jgi:hypothetical protein